LNIRKSEQDELVISLIKKHLALGDTQLFRLAIREFARKRGYWCADLDDMFEVLGESASALRSSKVKGVARVLARADRVLDAERAIASERA
jgi:hypothetical protein